MGNITILQMGRQLHSASGQKKLPPFIALTEGAAPAYYLPPGSLVILRGYHIHEREACARILARYCRKKRWKLLIAGDPRLALKVRAAGLHIPEWQLWRLQGWKKKKASWLVTAAAHSQQALMRAAWAKVDAALYSPVFPTQSHPGKQSLGTMRFSSIVRSVLLPAYALGGVNEVTIKRLKHSGGIGVAGIGLWQGEKS